ncbi:MAG: YtxH domain-containing protein [Actinomycetota bacterium]|nr:YtxH domain-containing protein [Actinomycetota bacterium]
MRFRLGVITGFAGGYYLGTKAGRERHEQINQALRRARGSDAFEAATDRTKAVVNDTVEVARDKAQEARDKAQDLVDSRLGNGQSEDLPLP